MKYIYPKFSKKELPFLRIGGAGLGNLLFTYSRALILAKETGSKLIFPTWASFKVGPWIRNEKDKRFYGDLFKNNKGAVDGLKKYILLSTKKNIKVKTKDDILNAPENTVLIYDDFKMNFDGLLPYRDLIKEDIFNNLKKKNQKSLSENFENAVNVHIRLGDFNKPDEKALKEGKNNTSIPIEWYVSVINSLREILGDKITFNIFSDGTDIELKKVLELSNTKRVFYGTSIADIVALSRAKLMVASGSSFSMWARFLGNSNSISYVNQRKDFVADSEKLEIETENAVFSDEDKEKIRAIFSEA